MNSSALTIVNGGGCRNERAYFVQRGADRRKDGSMKSLEDIVRSSGLLPPETVTGRSRPGVGQRLAPAEEAAREKAAYAEAWWTAFTHPIYLLMTDSGLSELKVNRDRIKVTFELITEEPPTGGSAWGMARELAAREPESTTDING